MSESMVQEKAAVSAEELAFAIAEYKRLADQEQRLIDKRNSTWGLVFTPVGIISLCIGVGGIGVAEYALCFVPLYFFCLALDMKHDEMVLHTDVRKGMKRITANYGYKNYDSGYSVVTAEWWRGLYKYNRVVVFVLVQIATTIIASWHVYSTDLIAVSVVLALVNSVLSIVTFRLIVPPIKAKKRAA